MDEILAWSHPAGRLKLVTLEETNANTGVTINLKPTAGKRWVLLGGIAYHDDSANDRVISTVITDGTNEIPRVSITVGANANVQLKAVKNSATIFIDSTNLILENSIYMKVSCTFGAGTTNKLYVRALVLELEQ